METGWIKLYRKLLNHSVFRSKDDKLFKTFVYCLLRANHKEVEVFFNRQKVQLKPGQFITGREQASRDLGYSPKTFDRKINDLLNEEILTRYMTRRFSIISITNWETYQGRLEEGDPLHDPLPDPLNGTNVTTDKKNKEVKKFFVQGAIALELASFLLEQIRKNKPDLRKPNLQTWARAFDLMIRRDKRDPGRIWEVISWAQADSFWAPNILSAEKLREKFDQLEIKMGKSFAPKNPLPGNGGGEEDPTSARLREMEAAKAVPCPAGIEPGFLKEDRA